MANEILTYNVLADTYVNKSYPTSNYAGSTVLRTGIGNTTGFQYVSFIGFNISDIPLNKIIKSIKLKAFITSIAQVSSGDNADAIFPGSYSPVVIRVRRVNEYLVSELESTLTYNAVLAKDGLNNPWGQMQDASDTSFYTNGTSGTYVQIPVSDISKSANGEVVVAIFFDKNYSNTVSNQFGALFASKEMGMFTPQLIVETEDYVPAKPINLTPNITTKNKAGEIKLSWQFIDDYVGTSQASYELAYSINDFVSSTTLTGTTSAFRTLSANTFADTNTVKWKVRITDTNGDTSAWSDIASFTIGATIPSAPEIINPDNTIVNSSDEVLFRWKFLDQYGYSQAKYDLVYKKGAGAETTVTVTSPTAQYIMPKDTLTGGDYSWNVRCYNAFNEVGVYSDWSTFYSIGTPALPIITSISNNTHPTIKWTASEQDLFIVKIYKDNIVIYDSEEQASGATNEYTLPIFLDDGNYVVGLQISNLYGFWSTELLYNFTIATAKPSKPSISGNPNDLYSSLIIASSTMINLIYRKGIKDSEYQLIGTITGNTLNDYSAPFGDSEYFVRSITTDAYNDSDSITVTMIFNGIILSGSDNQTDMINLFYTKDADKRKSIQISKEQYKVKCNGRTYPLSQSTEFKNHGESHEYFFKPEDYDLFYRIANYNTLLYRNNYGYCYTVEISNIAILENEFGYVTGFILTRLEE